MTPVSNLLVRVIAAACLAVMVVVLTACPPQKSIESINRDPGRFQRHEVTIAGRVVNSFAAMGVGVFEIDDGTGRLWVYSKKYGVPGDESRIAVTGVIQQGFSIAGRNFATILYETRRHS
ncbi:MAG TPA: OB-fold nucleic acid binding domain-containing protein [Terriglobales bacterium]|nr:OB-fold nucleic acid binding domain-containing protein [Terriglobales bacterium]